MTVLKFEEIIIKESGEVLVDLESFDFILEPVYFKRGLSKDSRLFLRESVAQKLSQIQTQLNVHRFKIWDGFRSREVQNNIFQKYWNELRVNHPEWEDQRLREEVEVFVTDSSRLNRIPPHTTGGSVDLTLVDSQGRELDMGTGFDHFGPEAAVLYFEKHQINETVRQNRRLLREAMESEGFRVDDDEWWHFDYGNQIWAKQLGKPYAIYGEAVLPK